MKLYQFFKTNGESKLILAPNFEAAKEFFGSYSGARYIGEIATYKTETQEVTL